MSLRFHSPARLLMVVLLMVAWLIATNHCALGLMKPSADATECPGCPGSEKQAPADGTQPCCQAMQGVPLPEKAGEKLEVRHVVALELFAILQVLAPVSADGVLASRVFDHGPARAISFAEAVLQRSLLSHAPPFAV